MTMVYLLSKQSGAEHCRLFPVFSKEGLVFPLDQSKDGQHT
jgi:hypothetical protein